jgi:ligand-binding sensor domain-containing protein
VEAVYRSTDRGETWQANPFTDRPLTTFALLIDTAMPQVVLAGTTLGIYRSEDSGQTWQPNGHDSLDVTVASLVPSPAEPSALYAGTEHRGLFRSTDDGEYWQPWGLQDTSVYAILADRTGTLWLGTGQGVFKSP